MEKLSLKKIAEVIGAEYEGDLSIDTICTDTRKISKGCLFIAFEGEKFDAHTFVGEAEKLGAAAVVCHKKVDCNIPVLYVKNTRTAFLDIAGYYRSLFDIRLVGITGSVGKTTTKEFVALAMGAGYKTLKTEGNFNNDIGMPTTLLRLDSSYEAAVIEMGMNHFGEIHNLTLRSKPTMAIITNIGVSHIEYLGSRDGILKAKLEILDGMESGAPLLLNLNDDKLATAKIEGRKVYYFAIENEKADFNAHSIAESEMSTSFKLTYNSREFDITIPTVGKHNVLNAAAAFAAGVLNDIEPEKVCTALGEYVPSGMRQKIVKLSDFTVIEDCYNASPDSMKASIGTLKSLEAKKRIAVLGDMLELGDYSEKMHREIGKFCADNGIDVLFGFGEVSRFYTEEASKGGVKAKAFTDREELLENILEELKSGTAILFKGSHAMRLDKTIQSLYERKGIKNE